MKVLRAMGIILMMISSTASATVLDCYGYGHREDQATIAMAESGITVSFFADNDQSMVISLKPVPKTEHTYKAIRGQKAVIVSIPKMGMGVGYFMFSNIYEKDELVTAEAYTCDESDLF